MSNQIEGSRTIGQLARATGVGVETIRYYERIGLLKPPARTAAGYRVYGPEVLRRLAFIRHSRELGFPLDAIRDLLELSVQPDRPCAEVDRLARAHLAEVEMRIAGLTAMKSELTRMIEQCGANDVAHCRIIDVLADHAKCLAKSHPSATSLRGPQR